MQIIKATQVPPSSTVSTDTATPSSVVPQTDVPPIEELFGAETGETEQALPQDPLDLLSFGTPPTPGSQVPGGGPSVNDFAPNKVVTLEEWLMTHPEGRFFLDQYIAKMENIKEKRFIRLKNELEAALANGGLQPGERIAIQEKLKEVEASITKMTQEIDKAKSMHSDQKGIFVEEFRLKMDLNGDGYIGNPDDENSLIVAKDPISGKILLLDHNKKIAVDPFVDAEYKPALVSEDNLSLIPRDQHDQLDVGTQVTQFDEAFRLKRFYPQGLKDSTFGAQIDVSIPEGFWVEIGKDGKPKRAEKKGYQSYKIKEFEKVTREDGKVMIGQNPPSDEEADKYIFVKTTDVRIFSEYKAVNKDGGYVYYEFKDRSGNIIMRMRVEGIPLNTGSKTATDGQNFFDATSAGIAANAGKTKDGKFLEHSSRISAVNVDAASFISTGKVLPANIGDQESINNFFETLGVDTYIEGKGNFRSFGGDEATKLRATIAANFSLYANHIKPGYAFESYINDYGFDLRALGLRNDGEGIAKARNIVADIQNRFGSSSNFSSISTTQAYLPDEQKYNFFKSGLFLKDLTGNITGTKFSDIIALGNPLDPAKKELLPTGTSDIPFDSPARGNAVNGGNGGIDIVTSKGGDLYAKGVSFLWRENETGDESIIEVAMANQEYGNHPVFAHIGDANAREVVIGNGDDVSPEKEAEAKKENGEDLVEGTADDFFDVPSNAEFTDFQNDLPGDIYSVQRELTEVKEKIDTASGKILSEVIHKDPLSVFEGVDASQWEFGPQYNEWKEISDSFFEEWDFFQGETGESEEI